MSPNEKSIGEERATFAHILKGKPNLSKNFFRLPNLQIIWETEKFFAAENADTFYYDFNPAFANTMLYAVLVVQLVCKYAGVGEGNLFFFGSGEKREGKSSFADFGFGAGEAVCKCAFAVAVGFIVSFINLYKRM